MNILITGASSGIGFDLAKHYARRGNTVFACGRKAEKLSELDEFGDIKAVLFDVTDEAGTRRSLSQLPTIDLAILNAGDCEYIEDATNFDAKLFQRILNINLVSMGLQVECLVPKLLLSEKASQLCFIGSSASMVPFPQAEAYGASKAGLAYLADALYLDLKHHGIHVSRVSPGFIKTPLTDRNKFGMPFIMTPEQATKRITDGIAKRKQHIQFPKRLITLLKIFSWLPIDWWFKVIVGKPKKMDKNQHQNTSSTSGGAD